MKNLFVNLFALLAMSAVIISCGSDDDTPAPVVEIYAEADADNPYMYSFTAAAKYVDEYNWNFGDGNVSVDGAPTHTYVQSGKYTVTLTAKGGGGETIATKDIEILASIEEMLTGGPAATNGKTWVMSTVANPGTDGVSNKVIEPLSGDDILFPATDNLLTQIGLGDEYDNLYTFKHDGSYVLDYVNDKCVAGYMYSVINQLNRTIETPYGLAQVEHTEATGASWTLEKNIDLVINAANEVQGGDPEEVTVTFEGVDVITFANGGFIGHMDFTPKAIIREITSERMSLTLFLHGVMQHPEKPSNLITISFDAQ